MVKRGCPKKYEDDRKTFDLFPTETSMMLILLKKMKERKFLNTVVEELLQEMIAEQKVSKIDRPKRGKLTTRLTEETLADYDRLCKKSGLNRTEYFNQWMQDRKKL